MNDVRKYLEEGRAYLGIELGSTRIKAVIIDDEFNVLFSGSHTWENRLVDGVWTYTMDDIRNGLQAAYSDLAGNVRSGCGAPLRSFRSIGISGMMHGYLPFDENDELLSMFRTWRNTLAHDAAEEMTRILGHNIPDRWSSAHLYHSVLKDEPHVKDIRFMTTLSGYIHYLLTGEKVLGIGDASGIFPIDMETADYRQDLLDILDNAMADRGYAWKLRDIFPRVLLAGADAGRLTPKGAAFLDISGELQAGIPLCPPEGDAATGMIATNSIRRRTGNLSAGTSGFLMAVMERDIRSMHREIEQINTPDGSPVAMVHANNCASDISAWVSLFDEFAKMAGASLTTDEVYSILYKNALEGDPDAGGIYSYNYHAGEFIVGMDSGCPMVIRKPDAAFSLANFMRSQLMGTIAVLRIGVDLLKAEGVVLDSLTAHGGLFKTVGVAQRVLAAALDIPVSVMETAGEGGAWGIAILAAYLVRSEKEMSLPDYLDRKVFPDVATSSMDPVPADVEGYDRYMEGYRKGIAAAKAAADELLG